MNSTSRALMGMVTILSLTALTALAQKPELVVQSGHSAYIVSVTFSGDGRTLASGSFDNTIKLWEAATGRELRTLTGHSDSVNSVAFSGDDKTLASGSKDNTIKLWEVATGRELRTLAGHSSEINSVAFSGDGKTLASGCYEGTIKLWDVLTGQQLRTIQGHSGAVNSVAISVDGHTLAGGTAGTKIKLWEVSTGRELRTLAGHSNSVNSVVFSTDGKTLASGSSDKTIKLWDVGTGRELRTLEGHSGWVESVAFTADSKTLASGSRDNTIKLWHVATGRVFRTITGHSANGVCVDVSGDGKTLASGGLDIQLWDVKTGSELHSLAGHCSYINSVAFSGDGKTLATGNLDSTINVWSLATGGRTHTLAGHSSSVNSVAFSGDGETLASGSKDTRGKGDKAIKLWEVATGHELRTLVGPPFDSVESVVFSPDGKILATGSFDGMIRLWDVATGLELRTLKGHSLEINSVAFSPNGKMLASGGWDNTIKLWEVETGRELRTLGHYDLYRTDVIWSVAFSADGKTLASGDSDKTVKLWEVDTGRELRTLAGHSNWVISVTFSSDGKVLASGSSDSTIKLWDARTGRELRTIVDQSDSVRAIAFSSDGNFLVSSADSTAKLWSVDRGELLATLIALDDKDWAVVTPDGLFDGSPNGWNRMLWRFGGNTFNIAPAEIYFNEFFYPGLLSDILGGQLPKATQNIAEKDRRQPVLKLELARPDPSPLKASDARTVNLRLKISEAAADSEHRQGSGAKDLRLFRNGSLVKVWNGDVLKGGSSVGLDVNDVTIIAGDNHFQAYAFNNDNIKSADTELLIKGADSLSRKGTAYILGIGINEYANPQFNLHYAVADAQAFTTEFKHQQELLRQYVRVEVRLLQDKEATKANILKTLEQLSTQAQPEDAVLVYFAGHGTAEGNRFYLIPHDIGYAGGRDTITTQGIDPILTHSVSDVELRLAFEKIDAGQILLVIDACNSGQALDDEEKRRGPMNSKGLAQLAYEKGMYILTAAQSYQAALEATQLGHGLLTYALVEEGLKTSAADFEPRDGEVRVREWLDYATQRVPLMQDEKLRRARAARSTLATGAGEKQRLVLQQPRAFYRRELETRPLIVKRTAATPPSR